MTSRLAGRFGMLGLVAVLSATIVVLSWPRVMASVRYLPVEHALDRYFVENEIPTERLLVLIRFAHEAIGYQDHYRFHTGLSYLHYLRGLDVHTPASERRDAYRKSEAEAAESLRMAPAQPALWLLLANIRWILHDEPGTIVEAWKMSIFTGRTHSSLFTRRVEIGLANRAYLDDEGLAMLRDQLRLAWGRHPGSVVKVLLRRDPHLRTVFRVMDGSEPEMVEEMEAWLERLR